MAMVDRETRWPGLSVIANVPMGKELGALLLRSEAEWLHERIERVSCETRARLAAAASELRREAQNYRFTASRDCLRAARKLETLAHERPL